MSLDAKPFYDLIKEETKFVWTDEHSKLFQYFKDQLSADCELAIPNDKFPYFITVDASLTGVGATLAQTDENKKMRIISYNSRIFTPQEQKMATMHRELTAIIYALQVYENIIIGSKFPITMYTDHKPILFLFTRKANLNHRFYRYQMILSKFENLKKSLDTRGEHTPT